MRRKWHAPSAAPPQPTVGLYSPSEPLAADRPQRLEAAIEPLKQQGYQFTYSANARAHLGYMAGKASQRAADIHELIDRDDVDMLLATWGGKQCNQLVSLLDFDRIARSRKPFSGFSDGCVLVNAITAATGMYTFHGPNVAGKMNETRHVDLSPMVSTESPIFSPDRVFGDDTSESWETWRGGEAVGRLFGGNLTTFVLGLVGTEYLPSGTDIIFFWEVLDERPQIVHQHLTCLANAGFFRNVRGMVVGDVNDVEPTDWKSRSIREAVLDAVGDFSFPVAHIPTFGHKAVENPAVPIGPRAELSSAKRSVRLLDRPAE